MTRTPHSPKMVSEPSQEKLLERKAYIHKKLRKINAKLNKLYPIYKDLNHSNNKKSLNKIIKQVSKTEYRYIQYLIKRNQLQ